MKAKKTPAQIQREIDRIVDDKTASPVRRMMAARVQGLRSARARDAASEGLSPLSHDEGELYDLEEEISRIAQGAGVNPRLAAPSRAKRKIKSSSYLALAALGIGAAIGLASARRPPNR